MPGITLPANPYWSYLDYIATFNLATGEITIDLSPSVKNDAGGVFATATIKYPNGSIGPGTFTDVYVFGIPMMKEKYWWGQYEITVTANYPPAGQATLVKKIMLTPPDCVNNSNDLQGTLQVQVNCREGNLVGRGFSGYAYQGIAPKKQEYQIIRYYPPESAMMPQTNITYVPFIIDAYEGLNKFKGRNASTYDLGDNIIVVFEIIATEEKTVRCLTDFDALFCGVQNALTNMRACGPDQPATPKEFSEINALLWIVTAGTAEGKDMSAEIARLEQLLGVDCSCQACAGQKIEGSHQGEPVPTIPPTTIPFHEFKEGQFSQEFK